MSAFFENQETITNLVSKVLKVESITTFEPDSRELSVFRGRLLIESTLAYDQLADALKQFKITPVFREEDEQHVIALIDGVIEVRPSNSKVNLILFLVTLFSTIFVGAQFSLSMIWSGSLNTPFFSYQGALPQTEIDIYLETFRNLHLGLPFGLSMMAILLAHEFGHYLAARFHKTSVTLPYFIPFPLSSFGTMGAFIQLKEPPKNKRILHDIGVSGPIAGLVVAIPILLVGLALSPVTEISFGGPMEISAIQIEGNSILYLVSKYIIHGEWLPSPKNFDGLPPLIYWIRYIFTGSPPPIGGLDVMLHPMAWAGWAGLLITALNLIPVGQLDGGHTLYVLFGKNSRRIFPFVVIGLGLLGLVWPGWWLWVALIFFFGQRHAEPLDQITQLDPRRKRIAIFVLILFLLLFTPIPLTQHVVSAGSF